MADVTTTFAAKDESFARTVNNLQGRLQGFQSSVSSFNSRVATLGASFRRMIGPLVSLTAAYVGLNTAISTFKSVFDAAGQLNDLAARTGESAGKLAILQRAFQNTGSSADAVGPTINRLQNFISKAGEEGSKQGKLLADLGINLAQLERQAPTKQLQTLARAISSIEDPNARAAAAIAILGRSGGALLPLLLGMEDALGEAKAQLGGYPAAIDAAREKLDAIGDNFLAIKAKAKEFLTVALVKFAPALEKFTAELARVDFTAMGQRFANTIQFEFDFFRALFADPSTIFGLYGQYMNAIFRKAGDTLISVFATAGNFFAELFTRLINGYVFGKLATVMVTSFEIGIYKFQGLFISVIEQIFQLWGNVWNGVISEGVLNFTRKLFDLIGWFASDFGQALLNPIGFLSGKLGSALADGISKGSEAYAYKFDSATGGWLDKARAGLDAATANATQRLNQGGAEFANALGEATRDAVANTEVVRSNFFGSQEALAQVAQSTRDMAAAGASMRRDAEIAALAQQPVPSYAESVAKAYEAAGLTSDRIRQNIQTAQLDVDEMETSLAGPSGVAAAMQETAATTRESMAAISYSYERSVISLTQFSEMLDNSGLRFGQAIEQAGAAFTQNIANAMIPLTDAMRGVATEATLQQAVSELRGIASKLPSPVLV